MLSTAATATMQKAVNAALSLDGELKQRLANYAGKTIEAVCYQPEIHLFMELGEQCKILSYCEQPADVTIEGNLASWLDLASANDKVSTMINSDLTLSGNSQLLIELSNTFQQLDIDWEAHLARIIGDVPAHLVGRGVEKSRAIGQSAKDFAQQALEDLIFEQAQLLPRKSEAEQAYQRLREIEMRAERAVAIVQQLQKKNSPPESDGNQQS